MTIRFRLIYGFRLDNLVPIVPYNRVQNLWNFLKPVINAVSFIGPNEFTLRAAKSGPMFLKQIQHISSVPESPLLNFDSK